MVRIRWKPDQATQTINLFSRVGVTLQPGERPFDIVAKLRRDVADGDVADGKEDNSNGS